MGICACAHLVCARLVCVCTGRVCSGRRSAVCAVLQALAAVQSASFRMQGAPRRSVVLVLYGTLLRKLGTMRFIAAQCGTVRHCAALRSTITAPAATVRTAGWGGTGQCRAQVLTDERDAHVQPGRAHLDRRRARAPVCKARLTHRAESRQYLQYPFLVYARHGARASGCTRAPMIPCAALLLRCGVMRCRGRCDAECAARRKAHSE
jgi:hypothetical protein